MAEPKDNVLMEKIVSLCKRRGFIFQSSEIYGGINGFWDYGPLGAELKRNTKDFWWQTMTRLREDVAGLDAEEPVKDAGLIAAAQEAEHFEIAAYGTLRTWAQVLGKSEALQLLDWTLDDEKKADQTLTSIAGRLNFQAAAPRVR